MCHESNHWRTACWSCTSMFMCLASLSRDTIAATNGIMSIWTPPARTRPQYAPFASAYASVWGQTEASTIADWEGVAYDTVWVFALACRDIIQSQYRLRNYDQQDIQRLLSDGPTLLNAIRYNTSQNSPKRKGGRLHARSAPTKRTLMLTCFLSRFNGHGHTAVHTL